MQFSDDTKGGSDNVNIDEMLEKLRAEILKIMASVPD
jgi:hypothetical protein